MKPTILLTGKTGQLGSELHRLLPKLGTVIAPERKELDLQKPDNIRGIIRNTKPELVVNAAAYTAVDAAENDEAAASAVNAEAPRLIAVEVKKSRALLVHFSTDYVFDGLKRAAYVETDTPNPLNAYGRTKLAGEEAIRDSGVAHLIFRTSWVYATHGRNFLLTILKLATEREELKIVDDQLGAPTSAVELARATTEILTGIVANGGSDFMSREVSGTYHMTAAGQTTWYEFAKVILDEAAQVRERLPWLTSVTDERPFVARRVLPISTREFGSPTVRPAYSVLLNARLAQTFGVTLADWHTQLRRCFLRNHIP